MPRVAKRPVKSTPERALKRYKTKKTKIEEARQWLFTEYDKPDVHVLDIGGTEVKLIGVMHSTTGIFGKDTGLRLKAFIDNGHSTPGLDEHFKNADVICHEHSFIKGRAIPFVRGKKRYYIDLPKADRLADKLDSNSKYYLPAILGEASNRNAYMAEMISRLVKKHKGKRIVVTVGHLHLPGIEIDLAEPKKRKAKLKKLNLSKDARSKLRNLPQSEERPESPSFVLFHDVDFAMNSVMSEHDRLKKASNKVGKNKELKKDFMLFKCRTSALFALGKELIKIDERAKKKGLNGSTRNNWERKQIKRLFNHPMKWHYFLGLATNFRKMYENSPRKTKLALNAIAKATKIQIKFGSLSKKKHT